MKILFFIRSIQTGGAERVLASISNELSRRKHIISIATDLSIVPAYQFEQGIHFIDTKAGGRRSRSKLSKIKDIIQLCFSIRKITINEQPDVVISFMVGMSKFVIPLLKFSKIPVIASEHTTFDTHNRYSWTFNFARWQINKLASRVILLTQYDKNYIGKRLKNTVVIPNPLSFVPINDEEAKKLELSRKNILACGNLNKYQTKGFDNLIKCFAIIKDTFPDWDLDILGAGDKDCIDLLTGIICENHLEERVHFLGYSNNVQKIMKEHSLFVLSSRYEGLPMVLMEAMAMGCACVSYDCVTGPREIINHEQDGLLIKNQDIKALAEGLSRLMRNDKERKLFANTARRNIIRFSFRRIVDKWEILIKDIVENNTKSACILM